MIKKYRRKPAEIEAIKWRGSNILEMNEFLDDDKSHYGSGKLTVFTEYGEVKAQLGDYVVKDSWGNFQVMHEEELERKYEGA